MNGYGGRSGRMLCGALTLVDTGLVRFRERDGIWSLGRHDIGPDLARALTILHDKRIIVSAGPMLGGWYPMKVDPQ